MRKFSHTQSLAASLLQSRTIMTREKFDIYFCVPETLEPEFFDDSVKQIRHGNLSLTAEKKGPQMYSFLEWAVPGLIVAFIAKSYFEGFLQEAGKDHYVLLKDWTKSLLRRAKLIRVTTVSSGEYKTSSENTQSKAISIYFQLKNDRKIKLLFDDNLDIRQWEKSIEDMLKLLADNYDKFPTDKLSKQTSHLRQESHYAIYGVINPQTGDWDFYDDHMLIQIHRNSQEERELGEKGKKKRKKEKKRNETGR